MSSAYLILENGKTFKGRSFGTTGEVLSEIVFTTGMTGYIETLTDKSYFGQTVVHTFPLIGNYGVITPDFEGDIIGPAAYIVKEWCQEPSNFRSEGNLDAFLKSRGIVGLCGIDTRALTKVIRENGVMNGLITQNPDNADLEAIKAYKIKNAVKSVSVKEIEFYPCENKKHTVALMDYGYKKNIVRQLLRHNCDVYVMPCTSTIEDIKKINADGVMLSNGPGDPSENTNLIENLKGIIASGIPVFGTCLGHQLTALAHGFKTTKLKYGHRGGNQPVKNLDTGLIHITTQNHGYAVVSESIDPSVGRLSFTNANDGTCEGIDYKNSNVFTVQFHPESCGGPQDTAFLFERFIKMMGE